MTLMSPDLPHISRAAPLHNCACRLPGPLHRSASALVLRFGFDDYPQMALLARPAPFCPTCSLKQQRAYPERVHVPVGKQVGLVGALQQCRFHDGQQLWQARQLVQGVDVPCLLPGGPGADHHCSLAACTRPRGYRRSGASIKQGVVIKDPQKPRCMLFGLC